MDTARFHFKDARRALRDGKCTTAYTHILEGWEAIGASDAHGREAGGTAWKPHTEIVDIAHDFTTKCLRDTPAALGGARRRKRRR